MPTKSVDHDGMIHEQTQDSIAIQTRSPLALIALAMQLLERVHGCVEIDYRLGH